MSSRYLFLIAVLLAAALVISPGCTQPATSNQTSIPATPADAGWKHARLETTMGNITIALDPAMPITAGNFESLVNKGFYNQVIFHRVIPGFMIQGGDPTGTGSGGPGYAIKDEFSSHNKNSRGTIAMANTGQPNSGGSQFFINLADNSALLNNQFDTMYPVFGKVIDGMDVVDAIARGETSGPPNDRPLNPVTIIRAEMI